MVPYLEKVKELLRSISAVSIQVVPQPKTVNTYALAKLAYTRGTELLNVILIEFPVESSSQR